MDALEVLRAMHNDARETFQRIEAALPDQRGPLWAALRPKLLAHEQVEQRLIYAPVARDARGRDATLTAWDDRHDERIARAEALMDTLGREEPRRPAWLSAFREFCAEQEQHMQEEEAEMWPRIRQFWGQARLDDLGTPVQAVRTAAALGGLGSGLLGSLQEILKGPSDQPAGS